MEGLGRSPLWLSRELAAPQPQLLLLDCRSRELYESGHVQGALSVALPALLLRRLRKGNLSVCSLLPSPLLQQQQRQLQPQQQPLPPLPILLYDEGRCVEEEETEAAQSVLATLLQKLQEEGHPAYYLQGGFSKFQAEWPHLCKTNLDAPCASNSLVPVPAPVVGLGGLCLSSDCSDAESDPDRDTLSYSLESEGGSPPPPGHPPSLPVQILPNLYLGSAQDSANMDMLAKLGIRYILNVTPNLPNLFEKDGDIHYKQIPISDHWSQNLSQFFPEAIDFIDEAVSQNCGVLVHCLAGISRSVTVTVAYLMQKLHLSLNDAYDLVKRQKSNISPNFNFMGQLLDFERSLKLKGEGPRDQRDGEGVGGNHTPTPPCFFTTPTGEGVFELDSA